MTERGIKDDFKVFSLTRRMNMLSTYQEGCEKSRFGGKDLGLVLGMLKVGDSIRHQMADDE